MTRAGASRPPLAAEQRTEHGEPAVQPIRVRAKAAAGGKRAAGPAEKLQRMGLLRDIDLVLHLPLRYEDETRLQSISELLPGGAAQVEAVVSSAEVTYRPRRQLLVRVVDEEGAVLLLRFLNFYGSQLKQLSAGVRLRVRGEVRHGFFGLEMVHPAYRVVEPGMPLPQALTPVYPSSAGVSQAYLRRAIESALEREPLEEYLPVTLARAFLEPLGLPRLAEAVRALHHPPPDADENALSEREGPAWRRIKFDELLAQQLSLARSRRERRQRAAPVLAAPPADAAASLVARLLAALPFSLTLAQRRVCAQISADLGRPFPMQRLLQGDVGSGKTVVAALAAAQAIDAGFQVALMAPTEILAEQHARKLRGWLEPLGVELAWLAGGIGARAKRQALEAAASGAAQLTIGTHAIIQEVVSFARLGLAIVDEQHRFGVDQRLALQGKGRSAESDSPHLWPHQLAMSATPIPRTLAMTYYADLDVSTIDESPPGRTPVLTRLISEARRDEVVERVGAAAHEGRQVYWVCPLIEESEALQLQTAVETWHALRAALPGLCIGLLHGRLAAAEKQAVMQAFSAGELQVLVATTVIEVGVDVPNASLMVIEHSERFGLAQLHQLRGRVGRGSTASVCVLLYSRPLSEAGRARLKVMHETNDGFEIARRDLEIRGPGEFLGARQSGTQMLRFADPARDIDLVDAACALAQRLLDEAPEAASLHLARWLARREQFLMA